MPEGTADQPRFTTKGNLYAALLVVGVGLVAAWILYEATTFLFFGPLRPASTDPSAIVFAGYMIGARVVLLVVLGVQFFRLPQLDKPWSSIFTALLIAFQLIAVAAVVVAYAQLYRDYGLIYDDNQPRDHAAADALYFSMVTWTTLGYGDFKPPQELRLLAASEGYVGYVGMAIFAAAFVNIFEWLRHRKPIIPGWIGQQQEQVMRKKIGEAAEQLRTNQEMLKENVDALQQKAQALEKLEQTAKSLGRVMPQTRAAIEQIHLATEEYQKIFGDLEDALHQADEAYKGTTGKDKS
jgi:hypothetical protein